MNMSGAVENFCCKMSGIGGEVSMSRSSAKTCCTAANRNSLRCTSNKPSTSNTIRNGMHTTVSKARPPVPPPDCSGVLLRTARLLRFTSGPVLISSGAAGVAPLSPALSSPSRAYLFNGLPILTLSLSPAHTRLPPTSDPLEHDGRPSNSHVSRASMLQIENCVS